MIYARRTRATVAFTALCLSTIAAPRRARAGNDAAATAAPDLAKMQLDIERLKQETRDQRQLILQLMQAEQQRYDVILKFLQSGVAPSGGASPPPPPNANALGARPMPEANKETPAAPEHESATVTGRVRASRPIGEAYVYLDGLRAAPPRGHTVEIRQRDKQFSPRVAVVPVGTRLVFPNQDTVIHNVFSAAPGNAFDLGSIKGGETSTPVVVTKPGALEIFCNIHSKMRADVLVVPNAHWARVAPDGTFQLTGVPVGTRKLVLWGPALKPVSQQVDVSAKGASVSFSSEVVAARPHLNKRGQAYGSYDE